MFKNSGANAELQMSSRKSLINWPSSQAPRQGSGWCINASPKTPAQENRAKQSTKKKPLPTACQSIQDFNQGLTPAQWLNQLTVTSSYLRSQPLPAGFQARTMASPLSLLKGCHKNLTELKCLFRVFFKLFSPHILFQHRQTTISYTYSGIGINQYYSHFIQSTFII